MTESTFDILEQKAVALDRGFFQEQKRLQGMFNARNKLDPELTTAGLLMRHRKDCTSVVCA